jgi:hypothetical protein
MCFVNVILHINPPYDAALICHDYIAVAEHAAQGTK